MKAVILAVFALLALAAFTAGQGNGPFSTVPTSLTPIAVTSTSVGLAWGIPGTTTQSNAVDFGGDPVRSFVVTYNVVNSATTFTQYCSGVMINPPCSSTFSATCSDLPGCSTIGFAFNCLVTGLSANTAYSFNVAAINPQGASTASTPIQVTTNLANALPANLLNAPVVAWYTSTQVYLTWAQTSAVANTGNLYGAPYNHGGSRITGYEVTPNDGTSNLAVRQSNGACTELLISNLTAAASYTFTVVAVNGQGKSAAASPGRLIHKRNGSRLIVVAAATSTLTTGTSLLCKRSTLRSQIGQALASSSTSVH